MLNSSISDTVATSQQPEAVVGLTDKRETEGETTDEAAAGARFIEHLANARHKASVLQDLQVLVGQHDGERKGLADRTDRALYESLADAYAIFRLVETDGAMKLAFEAERKRSGLPKPRRTARAGAATILIQMIFGDQDRRTVSERATLLFALSCWSVPTDKVLDQLLDRGIRKLVAKYRADRTPEGETTERKQNKKAECEALKTHIAGLGERVEIGRLAEILKGLHGKIVIRARVEEDGCLSGLKISV